MSLLPCIERVSRLKSLFSFDLLSSMELKLLKNTKTVTHFNNTEPDLTATFNQVKGEVRLQWKMDNNVADEGDFFTGFISGWQQPSIFFIVFALLTALVVVFGVQKGIEGISKILMPVLIVLIIGIAVYTMTIPGALAGAKYYILPN